MSVMSLVIPEHMADAGASIWGVGWLELQLGCMPLLLASQVLDEWGAISLILEKIILGVLAILVQWPCTIMVMGW